ncbi:hypothetical protein EON62_02875 [archaeon]|nr:MAG: hypothetical protein EON62_02875 [archaeon]
MRPPLVMCGACACAGLCGVQIYRRYVQRGSEEEVNLSHRLRSWEFNARDHITMLKAAQAEVLQMLALDPFPRFLRSPQCTAMLDTLTHNTSLCWAPLWTHTSSGPPSSHPGSGFLGYDSLSPAGTEACTAMGAGVCAASTASLERRVNPGGGATCSPHATAMPLTAVREADADDARSSHCAGSGLLDGESSPVLPVPVGSDRAALEHPIHSAKFLETLQAARQGMESEAGHWLDVFESVAALIPYGIVVSDVRVATAAHCLRCVCAHTAGCATWLTRCCTPRPQRADA